MDAVGVIAAPLWLAAPRRFAGIARGRAIVVSAMLATLLLASLSAVVTRDPPSASHDPMASTADRADVPFYRGIVANVRAGGDYYSVAAEAQRQGGYPVRPFGTMRLPTLAMAQAALPDIVSLLLLYAIALGTAVAWHVRLAGVFVGRVPQAVALLLLGGGTMLPRSDIAALHEIWAGLLIALSLGVWRQDRWVEAAAIATCAMLIRETAALYAIVMLVCAVATGRSREAIGWTAALAVLTLVVALHYHAWSDVVRPTDEASVDWTGLLGFGFFAKTITLLTALAALPEFLGALLAGLALFGWAGWRDPTATRVLAVLTAYALLIGLLCRADAWYWSLLVAPVSLVGLVFVPDALRDLRKAMFDKRRFTVIRQVR